MRISRFLISIGLLLTLLTGCDQAQLLLDTVTDNTSNGDGDSYNPVIDPASFVNEVDNLYMPLVPGTTFVYESETEDGFERNKVTVTEDTRIVMGVVCTVVEDLVWIDGELVEETFDWFAQDIDGNVWYFGEEVSNFEDGVLIDHDGAWEAGVDGAMPGIFMHANPQNEIGKPYRQELYEGEAEDMGEVLSVGETVVVPYATYTNCIKTKEWTPLEPGHATHTYYAPGVGFVLEVVVEGGNERAELVELRAVANAYAPTISPANFVAGVDNPYFPLVPGTTHVYEGETEDGPERIEVTVLSDTRTVMGVACTVVRDMVWIDGELVEDTLDWFAQDIDGNVWYFGEDVKNYEDGVLVDSDGSWEAGVDDAHPGIIMHAQPESQIGVPYRQEFYEDEAEDMGEVLSLGESVDVPFGMFTDCLQTRDWTPLEPGVTEHKYYAPGIGFVFGIHVEGDPEQVELVEILVE